MQYCEHLRDSGHTCRCPALRNEVFCYHHLRIHRPAPDPRRTPNAFIAPLETPEALEITITNILRAADTTLELGTGDLAEPTDATADSPGAAEEIADPPSTQCGRAGIYPRVQAAKELGFSPGGTDGCVAPDADDADPWAHLPAHI